MTCERIEKFNEKLAERNSKLQCTFSFPRDGSAAYHTVYIPTEKINKRNRDKCGVVATFCPFCGEKYRPES